MSMQDKEFDDLFRSRLDGLEIEPLVQVWENIDNELGEKRKKSLLPLLRIAASVIVLIAAAVLFIPKKEMIKPGSPGKNDAAQTRVMPAIIKPYIDVPAITPVTKLIQPEHLSGTTRVAVIHHQIKKAVPPIRTVRQLEPVIQKQEPLKADGQPLIAAIPAELMKPVVPDNTTPLTAKLPAANETAIISTTPVSASTDEAKPAKNVKRHGIHTFGDLVNLVVAKVDKRKDKVIEFTDTDDDESTITAVNLGPVKIKKDK